jgi:hypothetical protein
VRVLRSPVYFNSRHDDKGTKGLLTSFHVDSTRLLHVRYTFSIIILAPKNDTRTSHKSHFKIIVINNFNGAKFALNHINDRYCSCGRCLKPMANRMHFDGNTNGSRSPMSIFSLDEAPLNIFGTNNPLLERKSCILDHFAGNNDTGLLLLQPIVEIPILCKYCINDKCNVVELL